MESVPANEFYGSAVKGGGASESCKVTICGELCDVKKSKMLISYSSIGEGPVIVALYKTALNQAINDAIAKLITYLKTGSIYSSGSIQDSSHSQ